MTPSLSPSQAYPILKTLGDFEAAGHPVHQCPHPLFYHGVTLNTPNLSCALVDVLFGGSAAGQAAHGRPARGEAVASAGSRPLQRQGYHGAGQGGAGEDCC